MAGGSAAPVAAGPLPLPGLGAVILAGGRGRRLGGADKPALLVAGRSLLAVALAAADGGPIVVVGPARDLPPGVRGVREQPAGGEPAAALAAGFAALPPLSPGALVAVLAADLPGIAAGTVARLRTALPASGPAAGAVLVDATGHRQQLIGVWRRAALASALARRDSWHNIAVRELLAGLPVIEVPGAASETHDIDTPADLRQWHGQLQGQCDEPPP
ncbi:MAG: NTP transferase domain-containing protein [Nakamurella sp.]